LYIESTIYNACSTASIIGPDPAIENMITRTWPDSGPLIYYFPELIDTGTVYLNDNFAYYSDYICSELSYTIVPPLERVMEQDQVNPLKMSVYHESNFFAGNYTIEVLVQSLEWSQVFRIEPFDLYIAPCIDID
jgi:hypothetical protein